jgi:DNA repair exonuclease SbcCD ATPase subunit
MVLSDTTAVPTKIMTGTPDPPDEFESEEELKQYIDQFHDHLDSLEKPEESGASKLEMKKELDQIEGQITASTKELEEIHTALEEVIQSLESIELHGEPSTVGLQEDLRNPDFGGN